MAIAINLYYFFKIDNKNKIEHLDALWLELLVALIGEQFGRDSEYICGAVCNMRGKGHKVFLRIFWTIKIFFSDLSLDKGC